MWRLQLLSEAAAGGPISQGPCTPTGSMSPVVATVLVDPRGQPTTYRFNGIGALVSLTDALGQTTTYQRDAATNLVQSVTDPHAHPRRLALPSAADLEFSRYYGVPGFVWGQRPAFGKGPQIVTKFGARKDQDNQQLGTCPLPPDVAPER